MAKKKRTLTQRFVDTVKPAPDGKRDRYFDAVTPNFALSVTDKGAKSYGVFRRWPNARNSCGRMIGDARIVKLADARETALEWQRTGCSI
jgi:hypothetical protein